MRPRRARESRYRIHSVADKFNVQIALPHVAIELSFPPGLFRVAGAGRCHTLFKSVNVL
jgi:hypothetical protein